jgi:hypothetical protein
VHSDRYRDFIRRRLPDLTLPSALDEVSDPVAADKVYEWVTAWLLTQTRDTKAVLVLFKENVSFGFVATYGDSSRSVWQSRSWARPSARRGSPTGRSRQVPPPRSS